MKTKLIVLLLLIVASGRMLFAQQPPHDPLREHLFPPELLMANQQAIGLTEEQKTFVKTEIQKAQGRFTDLQWQLQSEMEAMTALLKPPRVDEEQVLKQLDKILSLEKDLKRTQMGLVVRIKNKLTAEQQKQLQEIKSKMEER